MRTKALLGLTALAVSAVTAMAAENVYSLNVVGYYNRTFPNGGAAGKYQLVANQFVVADSTVAALFNSQLPANSAIIKWTGTAFAPDNWDGGAWDDEGVTVVPGEGFFVKNLKTPTGGAEDFFTMTFVGEVKQGANSQTFTANQYKLISLFTPQAGLLQTDFGFTPENGDIVMKWTGAAYATYNYDTSLPPGEMWDPVEPSLAIGDGFFVKTKSNKTWDRTFNVP